jgi:mRNA-degrading endonuclease RelE of RelBE toxin-antitoxin system
MAYEVVVHELAVDELKSLRVYDQRRIIAAIRSQLSDHPNVQTRNRKCLVDLTPAFEHELPVWELRAGLYRVFYDVDDEERRVNVRAIRRKEPRQKTEDIV